MTAGTPCAQALADAMVAGFSLESVIRAFQNLDLNNGNRVTGGVPTYTLVRTPTGRCPACGENAVVLTCGQDPHGPLLGSSSSAGAPVVGAGVRCAQALADVLGAGFRLESVIPAFTSGFPTYTLIERPGAMRDAFGQKAVIFTCGRQGLEVLGGSDSSTGAPVVADGAPCAQTLAHLLAAGLRVVSAIPTSVSNLPTYTMVTEPGGNPETSHAEAVIFVCLGGGGFDVLSSSSSMGAPVVAAGVPCGQALADGLDAGFRIESIIPGFASNASHELIYTLIKPRRRSDTSDQQAAIFACDASNVVASGSSTGAPPVAGKSCAQALADVLTECFDVAAILPGLGFPTYTLVKRPAGRCRRPGREAVITCGGFSSSSAGAPVVAAGTPCAQALADVLSAGFRIEPTEPLFSGSLPYTLTGKP
ncbi:MAG: hypothetical protein E6J59_12175 [Deltaproteobacteria bacterium]|nr:MAG: hypothetical protein E6J59_12175 [Deltaproteobacteria bacterium]